MAENTGHKDDPRETEVNLGIRRVYNIGSYESLEVKVETTDKITWNTIEEREKKTENLTKILVKKFVNSKDIVFKGVKADEKHGTYKGDAAPATNTKSKGNSDELDELD